MEEVMNPMSKRQLVADSDQLLIKGALIYANQYLATFEKNFSIF